MKKTISILALALSLGVGCDGEAPAPIRKPECVTNASAACLCVGGIPGWQTCGVDRRWGACVCTDGGAVITPPPTCTDPFALCGGRCANLLVDQEHCGRCASPCAEGQVCLSGSCALIADASAPMDRFFTDAPEDAPEVLDDAPEVLDDALEDAAHDAVGEVELDAEVDAGLDVSELDVMADASVDDATDASVDDATDAALDGE